MRYFSTLRIKRKILLRKILLNTLLLFLPIRNRLIIKVSQNLDNHIVTYQKSLLTPNDQIFI
ncbi:hypothetical protein CDLVIII_5926 [Clostridium sp. DL-VIII]|nr:hypothetical protein CDLVIII_5926 [Clostridium sp. DL-VIII]